jgi:hypothetical protein
MRPVRIPADSDLSVIRVGWVGLLPFPPGDRKGAPFCLGEGSKRISNLFVPLALQRPYISIPEAHAHLTPPKVSDPTTDG